MLSCPLVICDPRGSLERPTFTAGHPTLLCNREDDSFGCDVPTRSRSDAVTDTETTVGGRHVIGRDGETPLPTRNDIHREEDRGQGRLVGVV